MSMEPMEDSGCRTVRPLCPYLVLVLSLVGSDLEIFIVTLYWLILPKLIQSGFECLQTGCRQLPLSASSMAFFCTVNEK
jgi:hypothetical protein